MNYLQIIFAKLISVYIFILLASPGFAGNLYDPVLGEGYRITNQLHTNHSCLEIPSTAIEVIAPKVGQVKYVVNSELDELHDLFDGRVALKLALGGFELDAEVQFAAEHSNENLTSSLTILAKFENGKAWLKPSAILQLNAAGSSLVAQPESFFSHCGTHYLSTYELSAYALASLVFTFSNETDKLNFDARLKVAISGLGEAEATVGVALAELAGNGSVRFHAIQRGGDPSQLSTVIDSGLVDCSTSNQAPCFQAFAEALNYIKSTFPQQFKNSEGEIDPQYFQHSRPNYKAYKYVAPELEAFSLPQADIRLLEIFREEYAATILTELGNRNYAKAVATAPSSDSTLIAEAYNVIAKIDSKITILQEAMKVCNQASFNGILCKSSMDKAYTKANDITYDIAKLVVLNRTFLDFCSSLQVWQQAKEAQNVDIDELEFLMPWTLRDSVISIMNSSDFAVARDNMLIDPDLTSDQSREGFIGISALNCSRIAIESVGVTTLDFNTNPLHSIEPIAVLPNIRELNLSHATLRSGWAGLLKLQSLRKLILGHTKIRGLQGIRNSRLMFLDVSGNNYIRSRDLHHIKNLPRLEVLDISKLSRVKSLEYLPEHRRLKQLIIKQRSITNDEFEVFLLSLDRLPRLSSIRLSSTDKFCQDLRFEHIIQCEGE